MELPTLTDEQCRRIVCIGDSYHRLTGRPLVIGEGDPIHMLWSAPYAIVAHSIEADPIFYFGNRKALELFEMDFDAFTHLASRLSAEPLLREERAHLLESVTRNGIVRDYAGVRVSATGKLFRISNASVWNVTDLSGAAVGQAAAFANWVHLSCSRLRFWTGGLVTGW